MFFEIYDFWGYFSIFYLKQELKKKKRLYENWIAFKLTCQNNIKQPETAESRCSSKQLILNIPQYSKENTCVGVSFS